MSSFSICSSMQSLNIFYHFTHKLNIKFEATEILVENILKVKVPLKNFYYFHNYFLYVFI